MEQTERVTDAELAEWRELCERATAGPWENSIGRDGVFSFEKALQTGNGTVMYLIRDEDALFVSAARVALPRLIAEVEALRAERDDWQDAAEIANSAGLARIAKPAR